MIGGVCALPTRLTGRLENDDRVNLRRSPALEKEASDARWRAVYCKVQTASNLWSGLSAQRRDVTLLRNLGSFVGPWKGRPILALHGNLSAPLSGQPPEACLRCPTVRQQSRPDSDYEGDSGIRGLWLVVVTLPRSCSYDIVRQEPSSNRWASKSATCSRDSVCGLWMGAGSGICRTAFLQGIASFVFLMSAQPFPTYAM